MFEKRLKKSWKRLLIFVLSVSVLLSGCTLTERLESEDQTNPVQNMTAIDEDIIGLGYYAAEKVNPVTSMSDINAVLCNALYESLFVLDTSFVPQKELCKDYTVSADGLVYRFTLADDIVFWSGEPLTASDVAESYRLVKNSPGTRYYSRFSEVIKIGVVDDKTVEIVLSQPNADFVALLDIPVFRFGTAEDAFSEGTGSFVPVKENGEYHLEAFSEWHGEKNPVIDRIELITTVRAKSIIHSFSTGDVSMTRAERICDNPLSPSGAVDVYQTPSTEMHYLGVNMTRELMAQPAFRRGLSVLIDRASICENALQTYADPALLPQNPQPDTVTEQSYLTDVAQAMSLFAQIGLSDSNGDGYLDYAVQGTATRQPVVLTILVNQENTYKQAVLSQIAVSFAQVGIQVEIAAVDFETFQNELAAGNYDLYYGDVVLQPDFDVRSLLATAGRLNYGKYTDLVMDGLLTAERATGTETAKNRFQEYFLQQMPIIPIAFERMQVVLRGGLLQNYEAAPAQMFISYPAWRMGS